MKNLREGAKEGGKDIEEITDEDLRDELIRTLRRALNTARVENSMNKLAKEIGVDYKTLYKLQEGLKNL
jgi:DNA-binding phage protein